MAIRWQEWIGKKVFIQYQDGRGFRRYTGIVEEVEEIYPEHILILIKDKFGQYVGIFNKYINLIEEEKI